MKPFLTIAVLCIAAILVASVVLFTTQTAGPPPATSLVSPGTLPGGFLRADGPKKLVFPPDFGPHPDYQTEWWYYTGNLQTAQGRRFGYQLTFFRRGLLPPSDQAARQSAWGTNQVYMAHLALSDVAAGQHRAYERFARGAMGLAGAGSSHFQVWLEDWQVLETDAGQYHLRASQETFRLELTLTDLKGPILHGEQGYSQKGPEAGNASYYFSQTRLGTSGVIQVQDSRYEVQGLSWMDHEFSTSALSSGQVGWDWFSIQLEEGSELMVYQIRRQDGSIDPFSSGTWVASHGAARSLHQDDFDIEVLATWHSSLSGAHYPAEWVVRVPSLDLTLVIRPILRDQEMEVSFTYWEGAVDVSGTLGAESVSGYGYVELTGYAASMEGEF